MGNENVQTSIEKFRREDWEAVERLPEMQVWQNKRQPSYRIEQYEIYTQNQTQMQHQKKMFDLRRRSPLLVAAFYLEGQPSEQFCSSQSKYSLFLQRIPIRLMDVEHVPYPDYLHLFDSCLKGFGQLSRCVGCFLVDEAMIGINEQGRAKAWLNEDFSKSRPFSTKITEQNMVRSLIDTIEKNIDSQLLPPQVPSVRNFLYKNSDSLSFDTAVWQFGEFIRQFNGGKVPTKLDCIDRVGGIYTIANREHINQNMNRMNVHNKMNQGTGFSDESVSESIHHHQQRLTRQLSPPQIQPVKGITPFLIETQSPRQSNIYQNQVVRGSIPQPPIQIIGSPRQITRQTTFVQNRPSINFVVPNQITSVVSPRVSQTISIQPVRQVKSFEPPIRQSQIITFQPQAAPLLSRSPVHFNQPSINSPKNIHIRPIAFSPPPIQNPMHQSGFQVIQNPTPITSNLPPQHRFSHQIVQNPVIMQQQQIIAPHNHPHPVPLPLTNIQPNNPKAMKFTVEVVPGKVYPQKSSTIFKQNLPQKSTDSVNQQSLLLDQHQPIQTTSQKVVQEQKVKADEVEQKNIEVAVKQIEEPKGQKGQKVFVHFQEQKVEKVELNQQKVSSIPPENNVQQKQDYQQEQQNYDRNNQNKQNQVQSQHHGPMLANTEKNFDNIQRKIVVSTSYELQEYPAEPTYQREYRYQRPKQSVQVSRQQEHIQNRENLQNLGSHQNDVDYEQLQKRLTISFNPDHKEGYQAYARVQPHNNDQVEHPINYEANCQGQQFYQISNPFNNSQQQFQNKFTQKSENSIRQTGRFSSGHSPNKLVQPQYQVRVVSFESDFAKPNSRSQYENIYKPQSQFESQSYNSGNYSVFNNYSNYGAYNHMANIQQQNEQPSSFAYHSAANSKEEYLDRKYDQIYGDSNEIKFTNVNKNDGKSSPDFMQRLNELTSFQSQKPSAVNNIQHNSQTFDYNAYLKSLTSQGLYSSPQHETVYGNHYGSYNYYESNQYNPLANDYTGFNYKIGLDEN